MTKQEYIQSLKKEVEQFHPFLRDRLFAAMQKETAIDSYDYTHGNNEQGADFIVITRDGVTKKEIAVAVIVKSGSITNSLETVERQISQSKTDKKNQDGEDFSVRRFWVITNNTISKNARDYIKDKFKNLNIEFWDYQEVVRLSDLYMGDDWLEPHHSTNTFLQTKRQYFVDMMSRNSLAQNLGEFSLRQTVVERKAEYNSNQQKNDPPKKVNVLECAKKRKMILLEGGFGTLSIKLCHSPPSII
ncbi:restriction endonuclease [Fibrobacter sp. UWS1]|uniref:restriction endonuclease n=1 Tax=Fibrobacter sp. UWS1 TaxID=1896220 RepID=UPI001304569B|nr:restriction endonuclease [Fibrobacter sp. UWS1]